MNQKILISLILLLVSSQPIDAKEIRHSNYKKHITSTFLLESMQEGQEEDTQYNQLQSNLIKTDSSNPRSAGEEFILITGTITGAFFICFLAITGLS